MDMQSENMETAFNAAAEPETRAQAREALNTLIQEYNAASTVLMDTFRGKTRFDTAEADQRMAQIISAHLDRQAFQIQLAALTCARLDGVDVKDLMQEVHTLLEKHPGAPALRR